MQFLFILIINLILWALFYLVISLKLERSASEFREKRLRREMDAIIKDFNETAERNISLLENRITVMKRLMQQGGVIKNLDVNIGGIETRPPVSVIPPESPEETAVPVDHARTVPSARANDPMPGVRRSVYGEIARFTRGASEFLRVLAGRGALFLLERLENKEETSLDAPRGDFGEEGPGPVPVKSNAIRKDFSDLKIPPASGVTGNESEFSEADITGLFDGTDDKYSLISDLHGKGCPIDLISRCSGIPAGEIRLVLNLHGRQ